MKRIILLLLILICNFIFYGQVTPKYNVSVPNATTTFVTDVPVGTKIYDTTSHKIWNCQIATAGSYTLTTAPTGHFFDIGDYNNLSNKPTIPAAQIQGDWNQSNNLLLDYIKNKPYQYLSYWNVIGGLYLLDTAMHHLFIGLDHSYNSTGLVSMYINSNNIRISTSAKGDSSDYCLTMNSKVMTFGSWAGWAVSGTNSPGVTSRVEIQSRDEWGDFVLRESSVTNFAPFLWFATSKGTLEHPKNSNISDALGAIVAAPFHNGLFRSAAGFFWTVEDTAYNHGDTIPVTMAYYNHGNRGFPDDAQLRFEILDNGRTTIFKDFHSLSNVYFPGLTVAKKSKQLYIDPLTYEVTIGDTVKGGGTGTNYWQRSAESPPVLSPLTANDNLQVTSNQCTVGEFNQTNAGEATDIAVHGNAYGANGGSNYAFYADAANASTRNYSFYGNTGMFYNADSALFGSFIRLARISAPSPTTDKLYNVGGSLYWNGSALGTGMGSVYNITMGYGLSSTQSPLTTTGTMKVDSTVLVSTVRFGHLTAYPTGILKTSDTSTLLVSQVRFGHLTAYPTLNQNTTGSSGSCTGNAATVTNGLYKTTIRQLFPPVFVDTSALVKTGKVLIGYSCGIIIDTIIYLLNRQAGTPSVTPTIHYGTDWSAAGTSVVTAPGAVTSYTTATKVSGVTLNNPTIAASNLIWLTWTETVAPKELYVTILGHYQ
jgi:hypothetical protein